MDKQVIRLRTGECVLRIVRDIDFMMLCDGMQYGRITLNGEELTVERPRESAGEWTIASEEEDEPTYETSNHWEERRAIERDWVQLY